MKGKGHGIEGLLKAVRSANGGWQLKALNPYILLTAFGSDVFKLLPGSKYSIEKRKKKKRAEVRPGSSSLYIFFAY